MATVVFADLVGSTGIFERLGDETAGRFVTQLTTALSRSFEQHNGRVVKLLGDGLFVTFPRESDAIAACIGILQRLKDTPVYPDGTGNPVQMQMGVESGEVVEIQGDCYGDAVNCAARLADLAGADQILATHRVRDALAPGQQVQLRSIGPMYLRGKSEATEVFRVQWLPERDVDATMMGSSMFRPTAEAQLELTAPGRTLQLGPRGAPVTVGRATTAALSVNDARVSRLHATVEWRGGHFILNDQSSFGTWVYVGGQGAPIVLRRSECYLVGRGTIILGCDRDAESAPQIEFSVTS
ncbi:MULTISPECIES: adenylate/guanylate cyclase domain-containing protein [Ramlibacter]|uniref:FHA domain-containing protein n=1 Tax=Ramlibacter pinisoli TaxID=2682844 RepID=A0A6N8IPP2_9BURK|nr:MULTISPECIES: adenylate/guanylate cyclase domain-containing protein [Ramlibacter]MBA2963303.1 adenylate/guanylate cyclase domain-containing protein [Ramlibacter sp. CGMCC 1.13660]MVQ28270.1 FHA domain-containing protein [Ramlibacter pinisoli]